MQRLELFDDLYWFKLNELLWAMNHEYLSFLNKTGMNWQSSIIDKSLATFQDSDLLLCQ